MNNPDKLILVGVISSAHGIKGDVIIRSFMEKPINIFSLALVKKDHKNIKIKLIRPSSSDDSYVCKIDEVNDRNQAENLKGTKLFILRESMQELNENEFYIEDLKGLAVINETSDKIGTVSGVFNFGAGDIIEIRFLDNKKELFPFRKELFLEITKEFLKLRI
jgi:16S rRNA processing protein RimM